MTNPISADNEPASEKPGCAGQREADEHHVAGHVRDEYPAQSEDARRVDETGDDRQHQ